MARRPWPPDSAVRVIGVSAETVVREGDPRAAIVDEAKQWGADLNRRRLTWQDRVFCAAQGWQHQRTGSIDGIMDLQFLLSAVPKLHGPDGATTDGWRLDDSALRFLESHVHGDGSVAAGVSIDVVEVCMPAIPSARLAELLANRLASKIWGPGRPAFGSIPPPSRGVR